MHLHECLRRFHGNQRGWPRPRDNSQPRRTAAICLAWWCVYVCLLSCSLVVIAPRIRQSLKTVRRGLKTGSLVRVWNMELSAAGDRIFAAEAILKRRVRKVSRLSPACCGRLQMLATASTYRHGSLQSISWGAVLLRLCNSIGALWLANAYTLLASAN